MGKEGQLFHVKPTAIKLIMFTFTHSSTGAFVSITFLVQFFLLLRILDIEKNNMSGHFSGLRFKKELRNQHGKVTGTGYQYLCAYHVW